MVGGGLVSAMLQPRRLPHALGIGTRHTPGVVAVPGAARRDVAIHVA